jgi:hypothetical protein
LDHEITPATAPTLNVSPYGFRRWAKDYYECYRSFKRTSDFSPVPYFLLCHAIELQFKAIHLEVEGQSAVKDKYGHNLTESYNDLPATRQTLSAEEFSLLQKASGIYKSKGFEYFNVGHAGRGFSNFPDLDALDATATKIIEWPDEDE